MIQVIKDSIVKGCKVGLGISFLVAQFFIATHVRDSFGAEGPTGVEVIWVFLYSFVLAISLLSFFLKMVGEDPFAPLKVFIVVIAVTIPLGLFLIIPIILLMNEMLALVFLGLILLCIQVSFLFSKPVWNKLFGKSGIYTVWSNKLCDFEKNPEDSKEQEE